MLKTTVKTITKYDKTYCGQLLEKIARYKKDLSRPGLAPAVVDELKSAIGRCRLLLKVNQRSFKHIEVSGKHRHTHSNVFNNNVDLSEKVKLTKCEYASSLTNMRQKRNKDLRETKRHGNHVYKLLNGVHEESNSIIKMFQTICYKRVRNMQKPKTGHNHIGIEIEFYSAFNQNEITTKLVEAKLYNHARIMTDTTIEASEEKRYGLELCLIAPENAILTVVERGLAVLNELGAEVNASCGFHVHLDCRKRNRQLLFKNLVRCQDIFFHIANRRKGNKYCQPQVTDVWDDADESHYKSINKAAYNKHRTLEIRTHYGTLDKAIMFNWIKLLMKIANYRDEIGATLGSKASELGYILKLDKNLTDYMVGKCHVA